MRQGWRFGARSAGWPPRCAGADASRLRPKVTDAFVDRAPIDWASLLTRPDAPSDRALIENLRLIDELRGRTSIASSAPITHGPRVVLARLVLGLAGRRPPAGSARSRSRWSTVTPRRLAFLRSCWPSRS